MRFLTELIYKLDYYYDILFTLSENIMGALDLVIVVLLVLWLGGFALHIAGFFIHILLVIGLVLLIARLLGITGRK